MSLRTITYDFNGSAVSPDTAQYGGVRFEDKATSVRFILDEEFKAAIEREFQGLEILYRIDFNGAVSGYNPSENLNVIDNCICRAIPLCMTAAGEQITAVLVATAIDGDGKAVGTVSSTPVKIYFDNVSRDETDGVEIAENISAMENKTREICVLAKNFSVSASNSAAEAAAAADCAVEAMLKTEEAKFALENGAEFVILGGDATGRVDVELVIDDEISDVSENLVRNKAILAAINAAKDELKAYTDLEIATFDFIKIVDSLGDTGLPNRLYLVPKNDAEGNDLFDEYIWANGKWEFITTKQIEIDLTPYVKKTDVADYIVEQGTSGIWTYRKWNSGVAECWASCKVDICCVEQRNSIYVDSLKRISLPEELYVVGPTVNINAVNATGYNFLIAHLYSVNTSEVCYLPASTGKIDGTISITFAISAKGAWK